MRFCGIPLAPIFQHVLKILILKISKNYTREMSSTFFRVPSVEYSRTHLQNETHYSLKYHMITSLHDKVSTSTIEKLNLFYSI